MLLSCRVFLVRTVVLLSCQVHVLLEGLRVQFVRLVARTVKHLRGEVLVLGLVSVRDRAIHRQSVRDVLHQPLLVHLGRRLLAHLAARRRTTVVVGADFDATARTHFPEMIFADILVWATAHRVFRVDANPFARLFLQHFPRVSHVVPLWPEGLRWPQHALNLRPEVLGCWMLLVVLRLMLLRLVWLLRA
jgi:hypothetical protein